MTLVEILLLILCIVVVGPFVLRVVAIAAGQLLPRAGQHDELYSEDVW